MSHRSGSVRVAMTGAAGFIGRAVLERIAGGALGPIADLRLNDVRPIAVAGATVVPGSYADAAVRAALVGDGVDILFHLASLPGGASERDPAAGRQVNLDGSIALLDAVAGSGDPAVVVYASSIAALGMTPGMVTDTTPLRPSGSYGTHKAMVELYLADLTRRGVIDGRAIRPAGIVARPRDSFEGFATAWMSDLFHAAVEGRAIALPAPATAQIWLQSVDAVADNIVHAATMRGAGLAAHRAWTLPATVARLDALIASLGRWTGHPIAAAFGEAPFDQPPLDAAAALALGFRSDGETDALVKAVLARIGHERERG